MESRDSKNYKLFQRKRMLSFISLMISIDAQQITTTDGIIEMEICCVTPQKPHTRVKDVISGPYTTNLSSDKIKLMDLITLLLESNTGLQTNSSINSHTPMRLPSMNVLREALM